MAVPQPPCAASPTPRELGLSRIVLTHGAENTASCRMAQKGGFEPEGTMRMVKRFGDGRLHDEQLHALVSRPAA
jgi:RimJ/RimL family protein N-acetyltransferase